MSKERINKVINRMIKEDIGQVIISDPYSIYYLTGNLIFPGERLLALLIDNDRNVKLLVNELFPQDENPLFETIYYNDVDDGVLILSKFIGKGQVIGIDKKWPSQFLLRLQEIYPEKQYKNISPFVDKIRQIKDQEEIEIMRESSAINDRVMSELVPMVSKGMTELELSEKVKELYEKHEVYEFSFDPITAYGKNGADPHHITDSSVGKIGDSVVLDIGGIYKGYASDMTRTVFIEKASDKQKEVYEIVKEANLRGIAAARPGNKMSDVDKACREYIEEKGYGKYFTHRTGHSIGLEAHEAGDVSSINDEIIEVGQVFSVEPGIYLPELGFGVRIEDLVLITEDGCEVLNNYSKDLSLIV